MEPHLTCSAASACTHFLRDPPLSPWDAVGQAGTLTVRPGASRRTSAQLGAGCDRGRAPLSAPPPFTCENGGSACLSGWCGPESHARQGAWQSVPWEPAPLLPTLGPNVTSRGLHSSQGRASDCEQVLQRAAAFSLRPCGGLFCRVPRVGRLDVQAPTCCATFCPATHRSMKPCSHLHWAGLPASGTPTCLHLPFVGTSRGCQPAVHTWGPLPVSNSAVR